MGFREGVFDGRCGACMYHMGRRGDLEAVLGASCFGFDHLDAKAGMQVGDK